MIKSESVRFVNRFFTPFAIILVLSGILFAKPDIFVTKISTGIIIFTMIFNIVTSKLSKSLQKSLELISRIRLLVNFTMNVLLIYYLGMYWKPLWLLFVLTPVAAAVYSTAQRTILTCVVITVVLVLVYFVKGLSGLAGWGQVFNHILFIYVISMFVHKLSSVSDSPIRQAQ